MARTNTRLLHRMGNFFRSTGKIVCLGTILALSGSLLSCNRDKVEPQFAYPDEIAPLMRKTCATKGCHNETSAAAAAGLNLETWASMFEGSRGGSPVVPYAPELSYLLYSVNVDPSLGPTLSPTMPYLDDPLTPEEYNLLWQWIDDGARNANGEERFPPDPNRRKWYVGHSKCDQVAIIDAESRQVMRYLEVGNRPESIEQVFDIKVTPDGKDWLLLFSGTNSHLERYSTLTDEKVADIQMGNNGWHTMTFSPDSRFAFVAGDYWQELAVVDLQTNQLVGTPLIFAQEMIRPTIHPNRQEIYMAQQLRSHLYIIEYDNAGNLGNQREVDLVQSIAPSVSGNLLPHDIQFLPDGSKYFVTCWNPKEVRVFDGQTDSLLAVLAMPANPFNLSYSASTGRIFVSCMDDTDSWGGAPNKRGSIVVINAASHQVEGTVYSGFQPYAMEVDEARGVLLVANRNTDTSGPPPHHESACGDRNGYLTLIDLQTLDLVGNYKPELLADPLTVAVK